MKRRGFSVGLVRTAFGAALVAGGWSAARVARAQSNDSPVGLWRTIDDATGQPKALVRIVEQSGLLRGRIEKILTDRPDAVCDLCEGELKGKPVQGMTILEGLRQDGEWWDGGTILDPSNGKVYRCRLRAIDAGARLEVRGYIGVPMLGRSQTWVRQS